MTPDRRKVIATLHQARASVNAPDKWAQGTNDIFRRIEAALR